MNHATILKLTCPDAVGLLARLTGFVAERRGNLLEVHQFTEPESGWFFARLAVDSATLPEGIEGFRRDFEVVARGMRAEWSIRSESQRMRMGILVSKQPHCLGDLFLRWRLGDLPVEIPLVISNHPDLEPLVAREGVAFLHVPFEAGDKQAAFRRIAGAVRDTGVDVLILARFMQVVPDGLCAEFAGRIINIHHSFLPAFVGANPYRRAYERGVKLIGATCHYATADLDEGPIIDQEVMRVDHSHGPEDLLRIGRDCERLALARGVRYHVTDRVLIHGSRTIVFKD